MRGACGVWFKEGGRVRSLMQMLDRVNCYITYLRPTVCIVMRVC